MTVDDWRALVAELVSIDDAMASGTQYVSNQGQALDGFSALAHFRDVAKRARVALAKPEPEGPTDEEIIAFWSDHCAGDGDAGIIRLARWGTPNSAETRRSLGESADGEVAELATAEMVRQLRTTAATEKANRYHYSSKLLTRAADLLAQRHPQPVPVSECLPGQGDCDAKGRCWIGRSEYAFPMGDTGSWGHADPEWCLEEPREAANSTAVWLPAYALPLPGEVKG